MTRSQIRGIGVDGLVKLRAQDLAQVHSSVAAATPSEIVSESFCHGINLTSGVPTANPAISSS